MHADEPMNLGSVLLFLLGVCSTRIVISLADPIPPRMSFEMVYGRNLKCVSQNGHFPIILFTKTDESQNTFPKNQLPK